MLVSSSARLERSQARLVDALQPPSDSVGEIARQVEPQRIEGGAEIEIAETGSMGIVVDIPRILYLTLDVAVAFILATFIGAERQYRQRSAGLRTNVLVAVGAATFVGLGARINGAAGAAQLGAYVVSGIGFLGAGAIMKEGNKVWGLNTAATLWCSAAIGALSGFGLLIEAAMVTLAVLAGNTLLRPLVNSINRAPFDERSSEANYEFRVVTDIDHVGQVRESVIDHLDAANYPVRDIEVVARGEDGAEIVATLVSTAVEPQELDTIADVIAADPNVTHAGWNASADD